MNTISAFYKFICVTLLFLFAGASVADKPNNGIQQTEYSFEWPGFYIECLNDTLYGTVYVTVKSHTFTTPSGVVHAVEGYFGTGHIYSLTTGRTWTQRFAIPVRQNISKGEVFQIQDRENFIPDEPGGQHFFINAYTKLTVNANGDLVVERLGPWDGDINSIARCVGKN